MSLKFECDRCEFREEAIAGVKAPRGWQILNGTAIWMRDTYLCPSCWKQFQVWLEPPKDPGAAAAADMLADIQRKMSQQTAGGDSRIVYQVGSSMVDGWKTNEPATLSVQGIKTNHALLKAIGGIYRYQGEDAWRRSLVIEVDA